MRTNPGAGIARTDNPSADAGDLLGRAEGLRASGPHFFDMK